jgi:hypothetical protein
MAQDFGHATTSMNNHAAVLTLAVPAGGQTLNTPCRGARGLDQVIQKSQYYVK